MRFASCLFVGVALLLVASIGFLSLRHRGASGAAPEPASSLISEGDKAGVHRLEAKSAVTHRLLEGELTLLEAAAWFRYINQTTGAPAFAPIPGEEGESEAEQICRQVIRWADAIAQATSMDHADTVARRLETELDEHLRRDGGVELPNVR
jgi:hypothetical protein